MSRPDPDGEAALGARCLAHAVAAVPSLGGGDARATRIAGGISNHLFLVARPDRAVAHCHPPPLSASEEGDTESDPAAVHRGVLVRLYGASEPLCHRPSEVELVQLLTARGFGPKVLGVFPGGRVEAFWAGAAMTSTLLTFFSLFFSAPFCLCAVTVCTFTSSATQHMPWDGFHSVPRLTTMLIGANDWGL